MTVIDLSQIGTEIMRPCIVVGFLAPGAGTLIAMMFKAIVTFFRGGVY